MTTPAFNPVPCEWYLSEQEAIRRQYETDRDGLSLIRARAALVDELLRRLWMAHLPAEAGDHSGLALVAIGGFGRQQLFPFSDIDLLFLAENDASEDRHRSSIRQLSQKVWDLHLRCSPSTRTLAECDRVNAENVEFTISLLDCRYVAGSRYLFESLHEKVIPELVVREHGLLIAKLCEITRNRHHKFGATAFHLEPNTKEGPGGLRDYHLATSLALVAALGKLRKWPDPRQLFAPTALRDLDRSFGFLADVRCFLHTLRGRDDNLLSWHAQDAAAQQRIGIETDASVSASEWMRTYFRHARGLHRLATQLMDESSSATSSLYRQFQGWRSRVSNADFSVVNGLVFLQQPGALQDHDVLLRLFQFVAHHGLKLASTTERKVQQVLPSLAATPPQGAELWQRLCEMFYEPNAADALRAMHYLGLLTLLLPELQPIDALVVRDFYHRFTVDEHSFLAIDTLHRLRHSTSDWERSFAELFNEIEQPELLLMALLLHDVGKGVRETDHVTASTDVAIRCLERLDLELGDREAVLFLVRNHLEMSAMLRRDIFDPATAATLAGKVGTPERLKMLCLLTYADIRAVNPQALTPWKAEALWQLYIATVNYLNHTVDSPRLQGSDALLAEIRALGPAISRKLERFVAGLPERYLRSYRPTAIVKHVEMAEQLGVDSLQLNLQRGRHYFELTVITRDRPFLFNQLSGVLAAWGMDIIKASAFSNQNRVIVDTFYFSDRYRTLELNLSEWDQFKNTIRRVLAGQTDLERLLHDRVRNGQQAPKRTQVRTGVQFEDMSSGHTTVVEVVGSDRPGLLYSISSRIAHQNLNIEIALIDTEGEMAIDVFYLTSQGAKLNCTEQARLRETLLEEVCSWPSS